MAKQEKTKAEEQQLEGQTVAKPTAEAEADLKKSKPQGAVTPEQAADKPKMVKVKVLAHGIEGHPEGSEMEMTEEEAKAFCAETPVTMGDHTNHHRRGILLDEHNAQQQSAAAQAEAGLNAPVTVETPVDPELEKRLAEMRAANDQAKADEAKK